jgi:hypothetical protein
MQQHVHVMLLTASRYISPIRLVPSWLAD